MNLVNNYIVEIIKYRKYRNTTVKDQTGIAFVQTQDKENIMKNKTNSKGESHWFQCVKQVLWAEEYPC